MAAPKDLEPVPPKTTIERAAAQPEIGRRPAHVALVSRDRLSDQDPFRLIERQRLQPQRALAARAEPEVLERQARALLAEGRRTKAVARELAEVHGVSVRDAYALVLQLVGD